MKAVLTEREKEIAGHYCRGFTDKEVASEIHRSEWTVKAHKKDIYRKLGISKDTELVLYMFCERMKIDFNLKEIKKHGIEFFFSLMFLLIACTDFQTDMRVNRAGRTRTTRLARARRNKSERDYELYS